MKTPRNFIPSALFASREYTASSRDIRDGTYHASRSLVGSGRLRAFLLIGALFLSAATASAETIEFPEDDFWRALTQSLAGDGPDFEALAKRTPEYRAADEFSRDAVQAEQVARLEARHSRIGPETEVLIRASVRLGDYDAARGGFPVSLFAPGTYLRVGADCGSPTAATMRSCRHRRKKAAPSGNGRHHLP